MYIQTSVVTCEETSMDEQMLLRGADRAFGGTLVIVA